MKTLRYLLVPLLLSVFLVEVGLRLLRPHKEALRTLLYSSLDHLESRRYESLEELMDSTVVGFKPGTMRAGFRRNSRSFRTHEYTGAKPPASWRVMALGDSFTDASGGVPFEEMWTSELQRQLAAASDRPIEVFALGVPGVGPRFEFSLWQLEHALVDADLVLVAFFVGNDFGFLRPWFERALLKVSLFYRLARNLRATRRSRREKDSNESDPDPTTQRSFTPSAYLEIEAKRFKIVRQRYRRRAIDLCYEVGELLADFQQSVVDSGSRFAVMLIPDEFQVDRELLDDLQGHLEIGPEDFDLDFPQRCLAERMTQEGIAYLDLLPEFRRQSRDRRLYWRRNTHWNVDGNHLAGRLLADFLLSHQRLSPIDPAATLSLD